MRVPLALLASVLLAPALMPPGHAEEPAESQVLEIICSGLAPTPIPMMEFSYAAPGCWNHVGHHTYFLGRDASYRLLAVEGIAFSVEHEFGAPTEGSDAFATPGGRYGADAGLRSYLPVEVSMDGLTWTTVGRGAYRWLQVEETLDCYFGVICENGFDELYRQNVEFGFAAQGQEFRFLRVREPYSAATHGLSGYLDYTFLRLTVAPGSPQALPPLAPGTLVLGCEDMMEDISPEHPCWFGGVDRWDSPSFFHTWHLGDARVDRVSFTVNALPWRLDDWYQPSIGVSDLSVRVALEASVDGAAWTELGAASGRYPRLSATVEAGGAEARFLRLVAEKHDRFAQPGPNPPANHHPKAFLLDAELRVEGLVPST